MSGQKLLIAVDLGSNSFHLVIAREQAGCIQVVYTEKQRVSLATGLDENNVLSEEAIERGLACLEALSRNFDPADAAQIRVVGTYTLRKAVNRDKFIERAQKVFPSKVEIIDGEAEAELIYQGVAHTQSLKGKALVIDIGGGSTEFIIGSHFSTLQKQSLELGSGTFRQRFFDDGSISHQQMFGAQQAARQAIHALTENFIEEGWQMALGTSGSVKVIAQVIEEIYGDEQITLERLNAIGEQLVEWGHHDKIPLSSVDVQRLPQLPGAVAILISCFEVLEIDSMEYCTSALREGVLYTLSDSPDLNPRDRTVNKLAQLHYVDTVYSQRVVRQLENFFEHLARGSWLLTDNEKECLRRAAQLHEIGLSISWKKRQKHGAYIIESSVMYGFNTTEQQIISALVRDHRGKISLSTSDSGASSSNLLGLIQLLRLAIIFTRGRVDAPPHIVQMDYQYPALVLKVPPSAKADQALMNALQTEVAAQQSAGLKLECK